MASSTVGIIGSVPTFDDSCKFEEWVEILEAWLEANSITEDSRKRAVRVFVTSIGTKGYHLQPNKPADKTFAECIAVLTKHYSIKPSEIVLRYRFYTRCQKEGESIPQFVAGLRQLSEGCNFQELDNTCMLRDRLVVGCKVASIQ